jgi:hypothetical protein
VLDYRRQVDDGYWEVGAAYRWLEDDYDFDRRTEESAAPGSFEHETRSFSLGLVGQNRAVGLDWFFSGLLAADRMITLQAVISGSFRVRLRWGGR